jgi:hypothetical protein
MKPALLQRPPHSLAANICSKSSSRRLAPGMQFVKGARLSSRARGQSPGDVAWPGLELVLLPKSSPLIFFRPVLGMRQQPAVLSARLAAASHVALGLPASNGHG